MVQTSMPPETPGLADSIVLKISVMTECLMEPVVIPSRKLMACWQLSPSESSSDLPLWLGRYWKPHHGPSCYVCDPDYSRRMGASPEPSNCVCAAAFHYKWKWDICSESHADPRVKWTAKQKTQPPTLPGPLFHCIYMASWEDFYDHLMKEYGPGML